MVKYLQGISDEEIIDLNIPTGVPLVQELDENLKSVRHYYLGDPERIAQAVLGVASQGKAR
jgi:2,3-bisphosphoglycerate-dependent phosphoglycerate mutase